jgi:hypothetical protein
MQRFTGRVSQNERLLSPHVLIIVLTFLLAGIVKGVTGMGLPTVDVGILGAIMSPVSAASLLVIPSFVTNFWQLFTGPDFIAVIKRLWLMMLGIVVGTLAGSSLLTSANTEYATRGAFEAARSRGMHVIAKCPFMAACALKHPEYPVILDG